MGLTCMEYSNIEIMLANNTSCKALGTFRPKHPSGCVHFLLQYLVIDMEISKEYSTLLGRPILATAGARIDVVNEEVTPHVRKLLHKVEKPLKRSDENKEYQYENLYN
ncbi:unnamed protein product [Linum trigynum]|uniref:Uncharacterized protein n=1 Tax=Linum trigynum TaxID=586398 RepID=A0AAV2FP41_9ROSI